MATTVEVLAAAFKDAGTPFIVGHPGGESVELIEAARPPRGRLRGAAQQHTIPVVGFPYSGALAVGAGLKPICANIGGLCRAAVVACDALRRDVEQGGEPLCGSSRS